MHASFEQFLPHFAGETKKQFNLLALKVMALVFAIITGTALLNTGVSSGALAETKADSFLSCFDKCEVRRSKEEITAL